MTPDQDFAIVIGTEGAMLMPHQGGPATDAGTPGDWLPFSTHSYAAQIAEAVCARRGEWLVAAPPLPPVNPPVQLAEVSPAPPVQTPRPAPIAAPSPTPTPNPTSGPSPAPPSIKRLTS